jgi:hypothetical protein
VSGSFSLITVVIVGVRMDLREIGFGVWIGFGWLRTGTGGGLL